VSDGGYDDGSGCAAFHTLFDHAVISLKVIVVDRYVIGMSGSSRPSATVAAEPGTSPNTA
jgi:hypothetical protein